MVRSPDGDTDFFDSIAGVLQGIILVPYMFIICLDYVLRNTIDLIKVGGFTLKMTKGRRYSAETMTGSDYTDDLTLLTNVLAWAESLLLSLEQAAGSIGLYTNANKKKELMRFKEPSLL